MASPVRGPEAEGGVEGRCSVGTVSQLSMKSGGTGNEVGVCG